MDRRRTGGWHGAFARGAARARGRALGAGLVLALAGGACGSGSGEAGDGLPELAGSTRTPPLEVGGIVMPDESPEGAGRPFAFRADPDGLLLVYFGYTSCPDICPTTLADIGAALRELPAARRSRVEVAMVTFDPERDSGEVITSYLDHFVDGGHALRSEDPGELDAALDAFRAVARRTGGGDSYDFDHSALTYGVDENGTVVVEWPFGSDSRDLAVDLETLLGRIDRDEPLTAKSEEAAGAAGT